MSRWLSEATPPDVPTKNALNPERILENDPCSVSFRHETETEFLNPRFWHPSRMQISIRSQTGGVASLNHRLMTLVLPGHKPMQIRRNFSFEKIVTRIRCDKRQLGAAGVGDLITFTREKNRQI